MSTCQYSILLAVGKYCQEEGALSIVVHVLWSSLMSKYGIKVRRVPDLSRQLITRARRSGRYLLSLSDTCVAQVKPINEAWYTNLLSVVFLFSSWATVPTFNNKMVRRLNFNCIVTVKIVQISCWVFFHLANRIYLHSTPLMIRLMNQYKKYFRKTMNCFI